MKKKAILLLLCVTVLSGCGRVDSVDVNSQITPFEVEQTTDENGEQLGAVTNSLGEAAVTTTASHSGDTVTTTAKTGAVNLVKRTGVVKNTVAPSRNTVRVPSRSTTVRNTTAALTTTGTTTVSTSAATVGLTTLNNENPTVVSRDDMICQVTESGISVMLKGEPVQNISIDTSYMMNSYSNGNISPEYCVNICDLNFDGNYDLFVPQSEDEYNIYGKFLRFNPDTMLFEEWEALSGITTYTSSSEDDETIVSVTYQSNIEYEEITYQWKPVDELTSEKELRKISMIKQYRDTSTDQEECYIKIYYEYPEGILTEVNRETFKLDENGALIPT